VGAPERMGEADDVDVFLEAAEAIISGSGGGPCRLLPCRRRGGRGRLLWRRVVAVQSRLAMSTRIFFSGMIRIRKSPVLSAYLC